MDIFEPKAGTCFLVMVDVASNFLFVEKIRTKSCKNIIEAMTSIFEHFGQPLVVGSDNMTGFSGRELQTFLKDRGIKWNPGTPYFSNHQQYAEGAICIVKRLYQKSISTKASFSRLVFLHNVFPNSSGQSTPFQIMYNRPANYSIAMPSPDQIPSSQHQLLQKQLLSDLRKQKLARRTLPASTQLSIGSYVRVYDKESKTYPKTGMIIEKLRNSSFLIEFDTPEGQVLARHARHLKLIHPEVPPPPRVGAS